MPGVPGDLIPPGVAPQVPQEPDAEGPPSINPDAVMSQVCTLPVRLASCFVMCTRMAQCTKHHMAQLVKPSLNCCHVVCCSFGPCLHVCALCLQPLQLPMIQICFSNTPVHCIAPLLPCCCYTVVAGNKSAGICTSTLKSPCQLQS